MIKFETENESGNGKGTHQSTYDLMMTHKKMIESALYTLYTFRKNINPTYYCPILSSI